MAVDVTLTVSLKFDDEAGEDLDQRPYVFTKAFANFAKKFDVEQVLTSETVIVWDPVTWTGFKPATFGLLFLVATGGELDLEFTAGEGEATEELFTVRLAEDVPLVLGADDAYRNHSASNAYGGTLDVIDKIRAKESNAAAVILRGWILA